MSDLLERITAKLDELQALAQTANRPAGPWEANPERGEVWGRGFWSWLVATRVGPVDAALIAAVASPDVVLRGIAEDREVLKRHAPDGQPKSRPDMWSCVACSHEAWDADVDHTRWVDWPCAEVLSVARRHGIEAQP